MVLSCPRCGTEVPGEALYCPYCSLPKPKRGFADSTENVEAAAAPAEQPQISRSSLYSQKLNTIKKRPAKASTSQPVKSQPATGQPVRRQFSKQPEKQDRKYRRVGALAVGALVAVLGVGIYTFVVPMVYSDQAEPKVVLAALDKLRHLPSSDPNLTVDARLLKELDTSRRVGNLVSYQGWGIRPVKGTKHRVLLVYSFQEVGDVQQSAEWLADLNTNTFVPQNDLAKTISAQQSAN